MKTDTAVLQTEERFFAALSQGDRETLDGIVAHDCILIDVLTGSEVPGRDFVDVVGSRRLVFESIERLDARVRLYDGTAIVTGQTRMIGRFDRQAFQVHSRYTHVYVHGRDGFRLVNAQGTPVAPASVRP
jgi:ketosteroid isomerase-like protein